MIKIRYYLLTLLILLSSTSVVKVIAQDSYRFASEGEVEVTGTSSLHDWHMKLSAYESALSLMLTSDSLVIYPSHIMAKAADLKSDSRLMDKKAHGALQADKIKLIHFNVDENQVLYYSNSVEQLIKGQLNIAGVKKDVEFSCKLQRTTNKTLRIQGELTLKMSDFGIDPPTAMMGTLKTGDDITIIYNLTIELVE